MYVPPVRVPVPPFQLPRGACTSRTPPPVWSVPWLMNWAKLETTPWPTMVPLTPLINVSSPLTPTIRFPPTDITTVPLSSVNVPPLPWSLKLNVLAPVGAEARKISPVPVVSTVPPEAERIWRVLPLAISMVPPVVTPALPRAVAALISITSGFTPLANTTPLFTKPPPKLAMVPAP